MFKTKKEKIRLIFAGILILSVVTFLIDFGSVYNRAAGKLSLPQTLEIPFRLGLDLLGGTHLVYRADVSEIPVGEQEAAVAGVRDVIERRVNIFGVSEPNVQTSQASGEHRILVELAGIKDVNQAINMIGETPLLEFKEQNDATKYLTSEQQIAMDEFNADLKAQAVDVLGKVLSGGDFAALAEEFSEDAETAKKGGEAGWAESSALSPKIAEAVRELKVGALANDIVEDENSFSIIKLLDKRPIKDKDLGLDKKEVKASHLLICYEGADGCTGTLTKDEARQKITELKSKATPANFSSLIVENSTEPGAATSKGELGYFQFEQMVTPFAQAAFSQAVGTISDVVETDFGFHLIYKEDERIVDEYHLAKIVFDKQTKEDIVGPADAWKHTSLTGKELKRAMVQFNPNDGSPEIRLEFNSEGKQLFADITERNLGKPVAIFLDGEPISIPTVQQAITSGDAIITGRFTVQEANTLKQRLNAGALPIPVELINQTTVGATLGKISVERSLEAGIIGIILVAIFMILVYRWPGILAVISLAVYGLIVLAVFKLWPVTLTLAGLAGFILSIGMAVDANVLIFARLKEELRSDKPMSTSINEAFRRAWPSIRDGNVSTLLICLVLIQFSTSIVKGFAVTLALGVIVSMFSAIVITKNLMQLTMKESMINKGWLIGIRKKTD